MILLFLGNWRSTLIIAVSIPLSILSSIIVSRCTAAQNPCVPVAQSCWTGSSTLSQA
jgi:hypothetical protein